jgi:hypothetical protein
MCLALCFCRLSQGLLHQRKCAGSFRGTAWYFLQLLNLGRLYRSKYVELEVLLEQKEREKQAILLEMTRRQEVLEKRQAQMLEILRKACQSVGVRGLSSAQMESPALDYSLRGLQSLEDAAFAHAKKRYKHSHLTKASVPLFVPFFLYRVI